jgi:hypothetical protein
MYRFSRSIYREVAPYVVEDAANGEGNGNGCSNRERVLDACESAMRRLAYDRRYFAKPARSLFNEIRAYFPIGEQVRVYKVIEHNINLALEHLARLPANGVGLDGQPTECRAHTRKGTPCQRQPLPGRDYCPSHKHLEEALEPVEEEVDGVQEERVEELEVVGAGV